MYTHLRVLSESYPTWQGLDGFQKPLRPCDLEESSLSIGRNNPFVSGVQTRSGNNFGHYLQNREKNKIFEEESLKISQEQQLSVKY